MKRSKYNSFNELPLMLTVQDVADVLGIGLAHGLRGCPPAGFPHYHLGQPDHRSPVINHGVDRRAVRPKKRKYFSGYFKDSVVFVCVAKEG